jgi:hypothetical protein
LETDTDPEPLEFTFAFKQEPLRIGERDFGKADVIASAKLCCNGNINSDHVRYFRVTTDGLAISQK